MKNTLELAQVGLKAIETMQATNRALYLKGDLQAAYEKWKQDNGIDYRIERDSDEWAAMMEATKEEYQALQEARRIERNAAGRLQRAALASAHLYTSKLPALF